MDKYIKVDNGHYRKCSHENVVKIWERKSHSFKLCTKCGSFWHKIILLTGTDYTYAKISDINTYRHIIFDHTKD